MEVSRISRRCIRVGVEMDPAILGIGLADVELQAATSC